MAKGTVWLKVRGGDEIAQKLEAMGAKAGLIVEDAAKVGAEVIREAAAINAASGKYTTGEMAKHIKAEVTDVDKLSATISVGPDKDAYYGTMVEFGHALVKGKRSGKKVVGHVPPHPFLRPALDEKRKEARDKVAAEIKRRLDL